MIRKNVVQKRLRQRFFVTPVQGVPFDGVLLAADGDYLVFGDVKAHRENQVAQSAPGDLFIRLRNVAYIQSSIDTAT